MWVPTKNRQLLYQSNTNDANYLLFECFFLHFFFFDAGKNGSTLFWFFFVNFIFAAWTIWFFLLLFSILDGLWMEGKKRVGLCGASSYMSLISVTRIVFYIKGIFLGWLLHLAFIAAFRRLFLHFFANDRLHRGIKIVPVQFYLSTFDFQRWYFRCLHKRESGIFISHT